ncbi:MAG: N-acetylmuramoyl-L-alanine amidase [Novosphingobium sp.]
MAQCPFAQQKPISGPSGSHVSGPFKIIHHTTEGSSAQGAMNAYAAKKADPHFTVDSTTIFQHVDTGVGARALRNAAGGVQTNRGSAVQIEVVAFAGKQKPTGTLKNVARLCRWIEQEHGIPPEWPAGAPKPPKNGGDPGGHKRDSAVWSAKGGHYGHCHVPENTHWDPAYSAVEAAFVLAAQFDPAGKLTNPDDPAVAALLNRPPPPKGMHAVKPQKIEDHFEVGDEP